MAGPRSFRIAGAGGLAVVNALAPAADAAVFR